MSVFLRAAKANISEYLRDEEVNILAARKLTALLMQKKRISYNHKGNKLEWPVKTTRNNLTPYTDGSSLSFTRLNRHQRAALEWAAYVVPEHVTWMEKLMNRGKEALVNYATNLGESIKDDLEFNFEDELFKDGNAAANAGRISGLQTCTGTGSAAKYPLASDTYAGLSTTPGDLGGAVISGTYPDAVVDSAYLSWSPIFASYNNSNWAAGTDNWANNCLEVLRGLITHQQNLKGKNGSLDVFLMTATMYENLKDALDEKERINVNRDGEKSGLVSVGFKDVINFDGVDCTSSYGVPSTQCYGLNFKGLELCSMQKQLFDMQEDNDLDTLSEKMVATFAGQMKINPHMLVLADDLG